MAKTASIKMTIEEYEAFNEERQKVQISKLFKMPPFETPISDRVNKVMNAESPFLAVSMDFNNGTVTIKDKG